MSEKVTALDAQLELLSAEPADGILVCPDDCNENWHFLLLGLPNTVFSGGVYHGSLSFDDKFPHSPPIVTLYTPNGVLQILVPLTIMSRFWTPGMSIADALQLLRNIMMKDSIQENPRVDEKTVSTLALSSLDYNRRNSYFVTAFGEVLDNLQGGTIPQETIASLQRSYASRRVGVSSSSDIIMPIPKEFSATASSVQIPEFTNSASAAAALPRNHSPVRHSSEQTSFPPPSPPNSLSIDSSPKIRAPRRPSSPMPPASSVSTSHELSEIDTEEGRARILNRVAEQLRPDVLKWVSVGPNEELTLPTITILSFHKGPPISGLPDEDPNKIYCKIRMDFSSWVYLQPAKLPGLASGEEQREHAKEIVVKILDKVMYILWTDFNVRAVFSEINLSDTEASMRAVFQGTAPNGATIHREAELEVLDLSNTRTSPRSLLSLYRLVNLRDLYLDYCPSIQKSGKHVFSLLLKKDPIPSLETLSVVGTSQIMSHQWLYEVESRCPKLKRVYFTRKIGTKALGWQDIITMQTMRDPHLMPCGHIGDRSSLLTMGYCGFDRAQFRLEQLVPINPAITVVTKDESGKWAATIVDILRQPLDSKCLYHIPCGQFMNLSSIQILYNMKDIQKIDEDLLLLLQEKKCPSCLKFLSTARICFPHSAEAQERHLFDDLKTLGCYGIDIVGNQANGR